jgi:hypothetical protein
MEGVRVWVRGRRWPSSPRSTLAGVTTASLLTILLATAYSWTIPPFQRYLVLRQRAHAEAEKYLRSGFCGDPEARVAAKTYDLCDAAADRLRASAYIGAIDDVAEDLNLCGHARCEGLWKWALGLGAALMLVWLGSVVCCTASVYARGQTASAEAKRRRHLVCQVPGAAPAPAPMLAPDWSSDDEASASEEWKQAGKM